MPPIDEKQVAIILERLEDKIDNDLGRIESKVDKVSDLISGGSHPADGLIMRFDRVERFLIDELGFSRPEDQRLSWRVKRLENIIIPIMALATPMAIWATIQILDFFFTAVFHPGSVPSLGLPTPKP